MMEMDRIRFGAKVRDKLTNFRGFVTARCEYLNGSVQYEVIPEQLKAGALKSSHWMDEQRLEVIVASAICYSCTDHPAEAHRAVD